MQQSSAFWTRWENVIAELPEEFCVSGVAGGYAGLHYRRWIATATGGGSLKTVTVFPCLEQAAEALGQEKFYKVLRAYGVPLKCAIRIYRICIPLNA